MSLNKTNITTLAAIAYHYSSASPNRYYMPKQCLEDARDEIVASRYAIEEKDKQIAEAARIIEGMKIRSKTLQEERDNALEMLNGKPETIPTVPAGAQQRGVNDEMPEA